MASIHTKVARILSETRVVLAAGANQDVKVGQKFIIYETGDEILDPEDGTPLGRLEHIKGRVEVVHVQDKLAVAETVSHVEERTVAPPFLLSEIFGQRTKHRVYQRLSIPESTPPAEPDLTVREGDLAKSVG